MKTLIIILLFAVSGIAQVSIKLEKTGDTISIYDTVTAKMDYGEIRTPYYMIYRLTKYHTGEVAYCFKEVEATKAIKSK